MELYISGKLIVVSGPKDAAKAVEDTKDARDSEKIKAAETNVQSFYFSTAKTDD